MTADELPDLEKVKEAIEQARRAEERLLELDGDAVVHDVGHPIMAPNEDDRQSRQHVRTHGRHRGPR